MPIAIKFWYLRFMVLFLVSKYRPYLTSFVNGRNDYINAVCVPVGQNISIYYYYLTVSCFEFFYAYHCFAVICGFGCPYHYTNAPPRYRSRFVETLRGPWYSSDCHIEREQRGTYHLLWQFKCFKCLFPLAM